jgi:hypothetical protein
MAPAKIGDGKLSWSTPALRGIEENGQTAPASRPIEPERVEITYRFRPTTVGNNRVSIIVPTCAAGGLIKPCIESLRNISTCQQIEIVCLLTYWQCCATSVPTLIE